jgi:hypothetical protein
MRTEEVKTTKTLGKEEKAVTSVNSETATKGKR